MIRRLTKPPRSKSSTAALTAWLMFHFCSKIYQAWGAGRSIVSGTDKKEVCGIVYCLVRANFPLHSSKPQRRTVGCQKHC